MRTINGRVTLVTGSSRGIGAAVAAAFLASDDAARITGVVLDVPGGAVLA